MLSAKHSEIPDQLQWLSQNFYSLLPFARVWCPQVEAVFLQRLKRMSQEKIFMWMPLRLKQQGLREE